MDNEREGGESERAEPKNSIYILCEIKFKLIIHRFYLTRSLENYCVHKVDRVQWERILFFALQFCLNEGAMDNTNTHT